ncbi:MAG: ABC transporter ATP-binding protein [Thermoproteales archaeon]|nr:ABC transporter ATP-binding protein [Thermoproteales archaeon]
MEEILNIKNLVVRFYTYEGVVKAIEGVNLSLKKGETLGLVGETGSGKSVTSLSILALVPPPGKVEDGEIFFKCKDGRKLNLLKLSEKELMHIRGNEISMVFQEPGAALNPLYTIGEQIAEAIILHRRKELCRKILEKELQSVNGLPFKKLLLRFEKWAYKKLLEDPNSLSLKIVSKIPLLNLYSRRLKKYAKKEAVKILRDMRIADPERVADMYPHELSGGMKQRAVIAMALACNPILLIADEPTTNLDVTVQAQILNLIRELKKQFDTTVLYITHDLGVIAEMCNRVAVMYAGVICELAEVNRIFEKPLHPYTKALLECIPRPGKKFKSIKGEVPNLINPPPGCRFHPRCPWAMEICSKVTPKMVEVEKGHYVACHLYG